MTILPYRCYFRNRNNASIVIGGWPLTADMHNAKLQLLTVYSTETYVWCIRHARIQPPWMNIFSLFKDKRIIALLLVVFYAIVLLAYLYAPQEGYFKDIYWVTLRTLQTLLMQPAANFEARRTQSRIFFASACLATIAIYNTLMSLYFVVIKLAIPEHQMSSLTELVDFEFRLAGDQYAWNQIRNSETVQKN